MKSWKVRKTEDEQHEGRAQPGNPGGDEGIDTEREDQHADTEREPGEGEPENEQEDEDTTHLMQAHMKPTGEEGPKAERHPKSLACSSEPTWLLL